MKPFILVVVLLEYSTLFEIFHLYCCTFHWLTSMQNLQTGKSTFVEHRTFLHLYRSFHRLWIFLVLMFQVVRWYKLSLLTLSGSILFFLQFDTSSLCLPFFQALTMIAFHSGNINLRTFKAVLSVGPTFAIMNFVESEFPLVFLCSCICLFDNNPCGPFLPPFSRALVLVACLIGCLDVLLMYGAYSTARGMAISRLVIRFFWCGLTSVAVTYLYL